MHCPANQQLPQSQATVLLAAAPGAVKHVDAAVGMDGNKRRYKDINVPTSVTRTATVNDNSGTGNHPGKPEGGGVPELPTFASQDDVGDPPLAFDESFEDSSVDSSHFIEVNQRLSDDAAHLDFIKSISKTSNENSQFHHAQLHGETRT